MAVLIDKKKYMKRLQEVMRENYHDIDYSKMSRYAIKSDIKTQMSVYVMENYGAYYDDKISDLLKEGQALWDECLTELGMIK